MADDDVDEHENPGGGWAVIAGILFFLATPLTIFSAVATYLAFEWQKVRMVTIFWFVLVPYMVILAIFIKPAGSLFLESWQVTIPKTMNRSYGVLQGLGMIVLQQAPIAIPFGIIIGLVYCAYRYRVHPDFLERKEYRLSPIEWWKKRKNIKDIQSDKNSPRDGMTLGIDKRGRKIVQTYAESSAHTVVLGASGSGKTTTMMIRARDAVKAGHGVVVIDLKGGPDFPVDMAKLAARYNKPFQHWLFQPRGVPYTGPAADGPAYYDPLARGEATRRKDLLIESRTWSEEYYKQEASNYIQMLFNVLVATPQKDISTLSDIVHLLDPKVLQERAIPLGSNKDYYDIVRSIDNLNDEKLSAGKRSAIDGLRSQLEVLLHSVAGPYLQVDPTGNNNIDIKRAADNGEIIVFSLDSSNYGGMAALVANLIVQDLKTVSSELRNDINKSEFPMHVIIDEFQAMGSDNIIGLINKARDSKMPVDLISQALGDLRVHSTAFMDQLVGIVGSFIIHRPNDLADAEFFAGLTGKESRTRLSESVSYKKGFFSRGNSNQRGTTVQVDEYIVDPKVFQKLKRGEMIYINKSESPMKTEKVIVIKEDSSLFNDATTTGNNQTQTQGNALSLAKKDEVDKSMEAKSFPVPPSANKSIIPITNHALPPIGPAIQSPTSPPESVPGKEPNMARLAEIFNQPPESMLPAKQAPRKDDFTVSHMPPTKSKPLPTIPPREKTKFPPLPVLPKAPAPRPSSTEVQVQFPTKKPVEPITNTTQKDEFDF